MSMIEKAINAPTILPADTTTLPNKDQEPHTPIDIVIPSEIRADLQKHIQEIVEQIQRTKPDLIVLPLRSAPIVAKALKAYAIKHNITLPPQIEVNIGKKTPLLYIWELEKTDDEIDEATFNLKTHQAGFAQWLKVTTHPTVLEAKNKLRTVSQASNPQKVLIIDDVRYSSETLDITAPLMLKAAYNDEVATDAATLLSDPSWDRKIIQASFGQLEPAEIDFVNNLLHGSLKADVLREYFEFIKDESLRKEAFGLLEGKAGFGSLIPINDSEALKLLGFYILTTNENNPLPKLVAIYGEKGLMGISEALREKFTSLGNLFTNEVK